MADLDGDGDPERVELSATVEVTSGGELLWEDGHHWLVVVRDRAAAYPLVERFVPWGAVRFSVLRAERADPPVIVVEQRAASGTRASIRVESFHHDPRRGGYTRSGAVGASGELLHGSPGGPAVLPPASPLAPTEKR